MNERVTISIVTYNSKYIFKVLDQLKTELGSDSSYDIHIYDNHSEAAYFNKLKAYVPFITLHEGSVNQGFGHGHNYIFQKIQNKYGIIFNPDVLVTKATLDQLLERIKADSAIALVSPKVLNEDGTTQFLVRERLTVFDYLLRFIPLAFVKKLFDRRLAKYECRQLSDTETTDIKMGSGCFMVIDREKFLDVGGFDERFFMYFEDNDLCLRLGQTGYRIVYTPFETVVHMYEKGAHKSRKLFFIFLQSMGKFFNKWGWRFF